MRLPKAVRMMCLVLATKKRSTNVTETTRASVVIPKSETSVIEVLAGCIEYLEFIDTGYAFILVWHFGKRLFK